MKTALIFLASGFLFLLLLLSVVSITFRKPNIDIHVHDTYFIISIKTVIIFIILFLVLLFFIGLAIGSKQMHK
jgi:heme/copper-type cytochrome/quinol oxidase subunit 1